MLFNYNMTDKLCECRLCMYSRKVEEIKKRRDIDELIATIDELMDSTYNMGADLDYANCILDGSWPSAVNILEKSLEKARSHPNRKFD